MAHGYHDFLRDEGTVGIGEVRLTAWTLVSLNSQCFQKRQVVS